MDVVFFLAIVGKDASNHCYLLYNMFYFHQVVCVNRNHDGCHYTSLFLYHSMRNSVEFTLFARRVMVTVDHIHYILTINLYLHQYYIFLLFCEVVGKKKYLKKIGNVRETTCTSWS